MARESSLCGKGSQASVAKEVKPLGKGSQAFKA